MQIWSAEIKELESLYTSIKGRFPELEKEMEQLIETKDANVVMLYSRRCLEVIITDLCECELNRPRRTEPLKGIIDKLNHEEKVPAHIITSMESLNSLSTYGTHPKEFDPEQVRPILLNLATIIKWYVKYKDTQTISKIKTGEEKITDKKTTKERETIIKIITEDEKDEGKSPDVPKTAIRKTIKSLMLLSFGLLLIAAIIVYPKIFRQDKLEKLRSSGERISVAIMPFQNMTNDTTWNVWQDGIQEHLTNSLSNSEELKVRQTESIRNLIQSKNLTNYASITPSFASKISQKLDANVFVYGNIIQAGNTIRVGAQLIDSNFVGAIARLTYSYGNLGLYDEAKKWCLKAYGKKNLMSVQQRIYIDLLYATYFETPDEGLKFARRLIELDDQMPTFYYMSGFRYYLLYQYDKAIPEFEKELEIYNKWGLKPAWIHDYTILGEAYHKTGQYKKERKLYKKAEQDFPDDWDLVLRQAVLALTEGDTNAANEYIEKIISISIDYLINEDWISVVLGWVYSEAGIPDKAEEYYRKALSLEPENPDMMHELAWFLIDKDRNINEGLELIDKVLKSKPEDYLYLNTKGWGLYKLGKYKESLELLEKAWALKPIYQHDIYLHLEEVKKTIANQKNT